MNSAPSPSTSVSFGLAGRVCIVTGAAQGIGEACARYPQMRVYDWAAEVKDDWFNKDGIHLNNTGCKERAARFARAIAAAFPKDAPSPSTCMVHAESR